MANITPEIVEDVRARATSIAKTITAAAIERGFAADMHKLLDNPEGKRIFEDMCVLIGVTKSAKCKQALASTEEEG